MWSCAAVVVVAAADTTQPTRAVAVVEADGLFVSRQLFLVQHQLLLVPVVMVVPLGLLVLMGASQHLAP